MTGRQAGDPAVERVARGVVRSDVGALDVRGAVLEALEVVVVEGIVGPMLGAVLDGVGTAVEGGVAAELNQPNSLAELPELDGEGPESSP